MFAPGGSTPDELNGVRCCEGRDRRDCWGVVLGASLAALAGVVLGASLAALAGVVLGANLAALALGTAIAEFRGVRLALCPLAKVPGGGGGN